ncbi:MAG: GntR family transcriptional regulator [Balneolaceae bacterium]|nr:GntR family transcriptional regulator [Balneolaceae bacterium]
MMLKDDRPRHEQISDWLRSEIEACRYETGSRLPSESELSQKFDVSRVTVRHALRTLENEGLIYRRQGLGSFVSTNKVRQPLVCLTDFSEDMQRAGVEARSEIVFKGIESCESRVAAQLDLGEKTNCYRLDRVRLGDGKPVAFDITWLPLFYGQLLENHDLEHGTIYRILEEEYEIPIQRGHYRMKAGNADDELSDHLKVPQGSALLLIERITMTVGDKKVYFQQRFYRTDRVCYEIELERKDATCDQYAQGLPLKEFAPVFFNQSS